MPIFEYACPDCRRVFSFFSKTLKPPRLPDCPKCGRKRLEKVISQFAAPRGCAEPSSGNAATDDDALSPEMEKRMESVMGEIDSIADHIDENNPKHLAYMMRKMQDILPKEAMPKDFETAIRRMEKGDSLEAIEEDMGDFLGSEGDPDDPNSPEIPGLTDNPKEPHSALKAKKERPYVHDEGLYDY